MVEIGPSMRSMSPRPNPRVVFPSRGSFLPQPGVSRAAHHGVGAKRNRVSMQTPFLNTIIAENALFTATS